MSNPIDTPMNSHNGAVVRVLSPHDPTGHVPVETLVDWWAQARARVFTASFSTADIMSVVEDRWSELALGTRIAQEITAGRWVVVAQLLRAGAVSDWHDVGIVLGLTGPDAAAGFAAWLTAQVDLHRQIGIGLTPADADDLSLLADGVQGGTR
ncbi:hypothetical protein [Amycolatopsis sp. lyj-108]|uniref:hypothetical protein n=1 Tax=Amycolatopsis sp. lyj-108 TaxID=2789286 RepID=UPI00397CEB19